MLWCGVALLRLVLAVGLAAALGCQPARVPGPRATPLDAPEDARRAERLARAVARLGVADLRVGVSDRGGLGAWAWPRGAVEVSRDLVDLLDDEELAAAVAHEVGHLDDGGHRAPPPSALGGAADAEAEARADRLGCRLLAARGLDPAATVRLLEKLDAALASPRAPAPFAARIARAREACPAE
jgi:Zn-dependent protease with chaperone function